MAIQACLPPLLLSKTNIIEHKFLEFYNERGGDLIKNHVIIIKNHRYISLHNFCHCRACIGMVDRLAKTNRTKMFRCSSQNGKGRSK